MAGKWVLLLILWYMWEGLPLNLIMMEGTACDRDLLNRVFNHDMTWHECSDMMSALLLYMVITWLARSSVCVCVCDRSVCWKSFQQSLKPSMPKSLSISIRIVLEIKRFLSRFVELISCNQLLSSRTSWQVLVRHGLNMGLPGLQPRAHQDKRKKL